jgi:hypothetical protein
VIRFDATGLGLVVLWTAANAPAHKLHKEKTKNRSGQLMCYQNRTSQSATDSGGASVKNGHFVRAAQAAEKGGKRTIVAV